MVKFRVDGKKILKNGHWYVATKKRGLFWFYFGCQGKERPIFSLVHFDEDTARLMAVEMIDEYIATYGSDVDALVELRSGIGHDIFGGK